MSNVSEYSTTAASNNSAAPDGAPEGQTAGSLNNCIRELMAALAKWYQDQRGNLDTAGTPNAYTLTTANSHTALNDIPIMAVRVHAVNTGAATLAVDGLTAKSWYKEGGLHEWRSGELKVGSTHLVAYNPTEDNFVSMSNVRQAAPRGHIFALTTSNAGDVDHDITIAAGEATDDTGIDLLVLAAALTKQIDGGWAVGSAAGGMDTGSVAADTTYHMYLIKRPDTGVVDALFSTSTSPTMPTNYTLKRRIASFVTDATANIRAYTQIGENFLLDTVINDFSLTASRSYSAGSFTVPNGIRVRPIVSFTVTDGDIASVNIGPTDESSTAGATLVDMNNGETGGLWDYIYADTSGQISFAYVENQSGALEFYLMGWWDDRGKFGNA